MIVALFWPLMLPTLAFIGTIMGLVGLGEKLRAAISQGEQQP